MATSFLYTSFWFSYVHPYFPAFLCTPAYFYALAWCFPLGFFQKLSVFTLVYLPFPLWCRYSSGISLKSSSRTQTDDSQLINYHAYFQLLIFPVYFYGLTCLLFPSAVSDCTWKVAKTSLDECTCHRSYVLIVLDICKYPELKSSVHVRKAC